MTSQPSYTPISCSFHDVLEASATLRKNVEICYQNDHGESTLIHQIITDIYSKDKVEFIKLQNGQSIRLDYLISVDGQRLKPV